MSDTDTGPELRVGQYGLRTFRVSEDGYLIPVAAGLDSSWKDGTCIAQCNKGHNHLVPDDKCSCGIYSFPSAVQVRSQYPSGYSLLAVVSLEGRAIEGEYGWRSEAARIVAIWMPHETRRDPSDLGKITNQLKTNYPNIPFHEDLDAMLEDYEGVSAAVPVEQEPPREFDKHVTGTATRGVEYLSRAIRPLPLILLAAVTFIAAQAKSVQGQPFLSNGMLAFHQGELNIAAHPLWVTSLGGTLLVPMMSVRYHQWRRTLLAVLISTTRILSLEAVCVVAALTAHSSVGWLDLLAGVVLAVGSVPILIYVPALSNRLQYELAIKIRKSCGLVQPGVRIGASKPPV